MRLVVLFLWVLQSQEGNYSQLCKTQFRSANAEKLSSSDSQPPVGTRSLDVKMRVAEAEMTWGEKSDIY